MAKRLRTRPKLLAVLASLAILIISGIGALVWALIATNGDDDADASADSSGTEEPVRGVWLLSPETGEAELVPNSGTLRLAQWVVDGETFIAREGIVGAWAMYDVGGSLFQVVAEEMGPVQVGGPLVHVSAEPVVGGQQFLLRHMNEQEQTERWTLFDLTTGNEQPLPMFLRATVGPTYSPDGTKVAYANPNGDAWSLMVANAGGTDIRYVTSLGAGSAIGYPVWSPDSSQLLVYSGTVWRVIDLQGEEVWSGPSDRAVFALWAGPSRIALVRPEVELYGGLRPASAEIVDIASGISQDIPAAELFTAPPAPSISPDGMYVISQIRNEARDFRGVIVMLKPNGALTETIAIPPTIDLLVGVDWTADSSTALLSPP